MYEDSCKAQNVTIVTHLECCFIRSSRGQVLFSHCILVRTKQWLWDFGCKVCFYAESNTDDGHRICNSTKTCVWYKKITLCRATKSKSLEVIIFKKLLQKINILNILFLKRMHRCPWNLSRTMLLLPLLPITHQIEPYIKPLQEWQWFHLREKASSLKYSQPYIGLVYLYVPPYTVITKIKSIQVNFTKHRLITTYSSLQYCIASTSEAKASLSLVNGILR